MNFVVVGAGAIGGVIGGYLDLADRVLFVDKDPDHVRAPREQGLSIRTASETFNIPVDALSSDAFAAEATPLDDVDAVLLAVNAAYGDCGGPVLPSSAGDGLRGLAAKRPVRGRRRPLRRAGAHGGRVRQPVCGLRRTGRGGIRRRGEPFHR